MRATPGLWLLIMAFGFSAVAYGGTCDSSKNASLIDVVQGLETSGIDFTLRQGGSISGHVYEADGTTAIYDVELMVYDLEWDFIKSARTDKEGYYRADGLPSGHYYVAVKPWLDASGYQYYDHSETREGAAPIEVVERQATEGINVCLPSTPSSISGDVYEADGTTIIDWAEVQVYDAEGVLIGRDVADREGHYRIQGLRPGRYYVRAEYYDYFPQYYDKADSQEDAAPVEAPPGANIVAIDFYLERRDPAEAGSISGNVYAADTKAPIVGHSVIALRNAGWEGYSNETGARGFYEIPGMLAGEYTIYAGGWGTDYIQQYYDRSSTADGAVPVPVAPGGHTSGIDFCLSLGGSISGRVCEAGGQTALSSVWLLLYDADWKPVNGAFTGDEGRYRMGGLETGKYYVTAVPGSGYVQGYYSAGLRTDPPRISAEGIVLRWQSLEGRRYKILISSDLLAWDELPATISATAGQTYREWTDTNASSFPRRFYKIRQLEE